MTTRDENLIAWTCRLRLLTLPLAHHYFFADAATPEAASKRLAALARAGYLRKLARTTLAGRAIYAATAAGHRLVGSDLRVTSAASSRFEHTLTVAELALWFHARGYTVTTEAEIVHAAAHDETPRSWLLARTSTGKQVKQYPDLVIERDGRRTIVEIELTRKSPQRNNQRAEAQTHAITAGWFHEVRYYIPTTQRGTAEAITRTVATAAARVRSPLPPTKPTPPAWLHIHLLDTLTWDASTEPEAPGSPAQRKLERARAEAERAEQQRRARAEAAAREHARQAREQARQQRLNSPERLKMLADMRTPARQPPHPPTPTT